MKQNQANYQKQLSKRLRKKTHNMIQIYEQKQHKQVGLRSLVFVPVPPLRSVGTALERFPLARVTRPGPLLTNPGFSPGDKKEYLGLSPRVENSKGMGLQGRASSLRWPKKKQPADEGLLADSTPINLLKFPP